MSARDGSAPRRAGALIVAAATLATLAAGIALKAPCASGTLSAGERFGRFCYADMVPLYRVERLSGNRLPYLDPCVPPRGFVCDEYPVLTMYAMRAAAWGSSGVSGFFYANALLLVAAALAVALLLHRLVGNRALFFALAPTLLLYGFINWDLIGVALSTAAVFAFLRRRDVASGVYLGLGAAAKLLPALMVPVFAIDRARENRSRDGMRLALAALGTWLAVNLPFAAFGGEGWSEFFRFNSARAADWDSLWFVACERVTGRIPCGSATIVNPLSLLLFGAGTVFVWRARSARDPGFPRWTFGFPLLVLFFVSGKVYSPQYDLWLLPWFALVLPDIRLFALFQIADVTVFLTRFSWLARNVGSGGLPIWPFEIAVLFRALVLVACVVAFVRLSPDRLAVDPGVSLRDRTGSPG